MNALGNLLKERRNATDGKQYVYAKRAGISRTKLCEIEAGNQNPSLHELIRIAKVYDIPYQIAVRAWLGDMTDATEVHDVLDAEVFISRSGLQESRSVRALLDQLSGDREIHSSAISVLSTLEEAKESILSSLVTSRKMRPSRAVRVIDHRDRERWSTVGVPTSRGRLEKRYVFSMRYGVKFLSELHRFPPRHAGFHRYPDLEGAPAPFEMWVVISGSGVLLVEENTKWQSFDVTSEQCGSYWGGHRHIWINRSRKSPLVVLQAFFPYKKFDFSEGGPGEAVLVDLDAAHYDVPQEVETEIREACRRKTR